MTIEQELFCNCMSFLKILRQNAAKREEVAQ